jgi:ATP-dependent helicase/DNAse subunit B
LLRTEAFEALLGKVEENLRRMGLEIYSGNAKVAPFQKGHESACDDCECRAVCRIDFWTHQFRRLAKTG